MSKHESLLKCVGFRPEYILDKFQRWIIYRNEVDGDILDHHSCGAT